MNAVQEQHPSAEQLTAFGLGRLGDLGMDRNGVGIDAAALVVDLDRDPARLHVAADHHRLTIVDGLAPLRVDGVGEGLGHGEPQVVDAAVRQLRTGLGDHFNIDCCAQAAGADQIGRKRERAHAGIVNCGSPMFALT